MGVKKAKSQKIVLQMCFIVRTVSLKQCTYLFDLYLLVKVCTLKTTARHTSIRARFAFSSLTSTLSHDQFTTSLVAFQSVIQLLTSFWSFSFKTLLLKEGIRHSFISLIIHCKKRTSN